MDVSLVKKLDKESQNIRKLLLNLCQKEVIHIGGDLSVADIMTVLWQYKINYNSNNPKDDNRDRFVLSKSHSSAVMSFNQAAIGCFSYNDVYDEYAQDNGRFSMHSCNLVNPYVEISTGSLGHGLPVACGIAAALKLKNNKTSRVYTIMGDGEQSEGSIWEAAANAKMCKLGNLVAIVDNNGIEADGYIENISGYTNLAERYKSFGWNTIEIDGHNHAQIIECFDNLPSIDSLLPTVIIAHTIKGKGVDFMERNPKWHAGKITEEQKNRVFKQLDLDFNKRWNNE